MNDLKMCWRPIEKIIPYSKNARKIPQKAIDKVAASLREYGWRQCIIVDSDGGDLRRSRPPACCASAWLDGSVADNLTPAQIQAYGLMDNRSHEEADWDLDLLGLELQELRDLDFNLDLTGFDDRGIDDFRAPEKFFETLPAVATSSIN